MALRLSTLQVAMIDDLITPILDWWMALRLSTLQMATIDDLITTICRVDGASLIHPTNGYAYRFNHDYFGLVDGASLIHPTNGYAYRFNYDYLDWWMALRLSTLQMATIGDLITTILDWWMALRLSTLQITKLTYSNT